MNTAARLRVLCWLAPAWIASASCLPDIDFAQKRCPCDRGYVCDRARDRCVFAGAGDAAVGFAPDAGRCVPRASASGFTAVWSTANAIRWGWDPAGPADELDRYELYVARSERDAIERGDGALRFDAARNPELGGFYLGFTSFTGEDGGESGDITRATTSDGLEPETDYYAVLVVIDRAGCELRLPASGALAAQTLAPASVELVLFDDELPQATMLIDAEHVSSAECEGGGGSCLRTLDCAQPTCWWNARLRDLTYAFDDLVVLGFDRNVFADRAVVEFHIRSDSAVPPYWATLWLEVGLAAAGETEPPTWRVEPYSLRNDRAWQQVQIPLRALRGQTGGALSYGDIATAQPADRALSAFNVGTRLTQGTHLWVDRVSVRW